MAVTTKSPAGYVRLDRAAAILRCAHTTVWRYIDEGLLDALKIGTTHLVKESDVRSFTRPKLGRPPFRSGKHGR